MAGAKSCYSRSDWGSAVGVGAKLSWPVKRNVASRNTQAYSHLTSGEGDNVTWERMFFPISASSIKFVI